MIRNLILAFALVELGFMSSICFGAPKQITIADAQRYAIEHNFGLRAIKMEIEANRADQTISRSLFLPKFGTTWGFQNLEGSTQKESGTIGYVYGTWNLFNGFADQMELKKTKILGQVAESNYRLAEIELKSGVERSFYLYLFHKSRFSSYEQAKKLNENHLASARRRKASGLISDSDLMEFELRASMISSEMTLITQQMDETKLALVRLMGPDFGTSFDPVGALPHMHLEGGIDDYLGQVSTSVEAIKQSALNSESAVYELRRSRSAWLPIVDLSVKVGSLPLDERLDYEDSQGMNGMVTAKWEFFSGFSTSGEIRRAEAQLSRRELESKQQLLSIMAAVEGSIRKLKSIEARVDVEVQNEERAQRLYRSTLSEYNRGVKNSMDLKTAEQTLLDARLRRIGYKNEFLEVKSALETTYNIRLNLTEHKDTH